MAVTFDTTIGGTAANSYISVADADDYFLMRYSDGGWSDLTDAVKERALMAATRALDKRRFLGSPASQTQRLKFPRYDVPKANNEQRGEYASGYGRSVLYAVYLSTEIPAPIKDATCEMALYLITNTSAESSTRRIESFTSDGQSFTFEKDGRSSDAMPSEVESVLHPLLMPAMRVR